MKLIRTLIAIFNDDEILPVSADDLEFDFPFNAPFSYWDLLHFQKYRYRKDPFQPCKMLIALAYSIDWTSSPYYGVTTPYRDDIEHPDTFDYFVDHGNAPIILHPNITYQDLQEKTWEYVEEEEVVQQPKRRRRATDPAPPAADAIVQQVPAADPIVQQVPAADPIVQQVPAADPIVQQVPAADPIVQQDDEALHAANPIEEEGGAQQDGTPAAEISSAPPSQQEEGGAQQDGTPAAEISSSLEVLAIAASQVPPATTQNINPTNSSITSISSDNSEDPVIFTLLTESNPSSSSGDSVDPTINNSSSSLSNPSSSSIVSGNFISSDYSEDPVTPSGAIQELENFISSKQISSQKLENVFTLPPITSSSSIIPNSSNPPYSSLLNHSAAHSSSVDPFLTLISERKFDQLKNNFRMEVTYVRQASMDQINQTEDEVENIEHSRPLSSKICFSNILLYVLRKSINDLNLLVYEGGQEEEVKSSFLNSINQLNSDRISFIDWDDMKLFYDPYRVPIEELDDGPYECIVASNLVTLLADDEQEDDQHDENMEEPNEEPRLSEKQTILRHIFIKIFGLDRILIARSSLEATKIWKAFPQTFSIVTLDGFNISLNGVMKKKNKLFAFNDNFNNY
jgi:hypothetical protein